MNDLSPIPKGTFWVMSYVSQSHVPDLWCLFPETTSLICMDEDSLISFLEGLSGVLKYYHGEGFHSFNVSMFSGREDEGYRVNAKVCPRHTLRDIGNSDHTYFQALQKEPTAVRPPESVCPKVRKFFP